MVGLDEAFRYALGDKPTQPASTPARAGEPGGLTKREMEIAELVAQGMSNKAIAVRLFIGRRTVETHVENILAKLGYISRIQVPSWLMEHKRQSP